MKVLQQQFTEVARYLQLQVVGMVHYHNYCNHKDNYRFLLMLCIAWCHYHFVCCVLTLYYGLCINYVIVRLWPRVVYLNCTREAGI
jgi:hypothetical protein